MGEITTQSLVIQVGSSITLLNQFNNGLPNILSALWAQDAGQRNETSYIENHLLVDMKNFPSDIDVSINDKGELIIIGEDADQYSLNTNGDLIYTIP